MMFQTIALAACGLIVATGTGAAPSATAANGQVEPDIPNAKQVGKRYLKITCPPTMAAMRTNRLFQNAFGNKVEIGTPVPYSIRQGYLEVARTASRAGVKMNRANWPEEIQGAIDRLTRYYYTAPAAFRARNTPTVTGAWRKSPADPGQAATNVRIALGLPPVGRGCGKYA